MHDFCFTIPYAFLLIIGGFVGFATKSSLGSLAGGLASGFLLILAAYLSLHSFHKRKNSYLALILQTVTATGLTYVMGQRYMETSKIMPSGMIAGISALMTAFYAYKLASGGNHFPAKAE